MFDLKSLQKVIVKNMLRVANNSKNIKQGNHDAAIVDALEQLKEDYKKENPDHDINMAEIDLSKVKIIKENE